MRNELTRQSEQRSRLVGIEARRSLIIMDQYRNAFSKTDSVTADGNPSTSGLTEEFLALSDYSIKRLEERGIEVPLVPVGKPEHSFHSRLRTAFDHRFAKPFPPYVQEYIDPVAHTRYVITDRTERINKRNRMFVPEEEGYTPGASFFERARQMREDWRGTVVFDAYSGYPRYTDDSFTAWSAEINGTEGLLCVEEIQAVHDVLTNLHAPFPPDEVERRSTEMLSERMIAVQNAVEAVEALHSHIVKDTLKRVASAIKKADFYHSLLSETPTRLKLNGKRVYFYPSSAEFVTKDGVAVSNEEYLGLSLFALSYLLKSVPDGTLPRDLYAE